MYLNMSAAITISGRYISPSVGHLTMGIPLPIRYTFISDHCHMCDHVKQNCQSHDSEEEHPKSNQVRISSQTLTNPETERHGFFAFNPSACIILIFLGRRQCWFQTLAEFVGRFNAVMAQTQSNLFLEYSLLHFSPLQRVLKASLSFWSLVPA